MCQQVLNLSIACCQWTRSVIVFSNLVTSAFFLHKTEPERKPLWTPGGTPGLLQALEEDLKGSAVLLPSCRSAKVARLSLRTHPFPSHIQTRQRSQLQRTGGRPGEEIHLKRKEEPKVLFRNGHTGPATHRPTAALPKCVQLCVWQDVYMGHDGGCAVCAPRSQKWLLCLGPFLPLSLRKPYQSVQFSCH